jgi:uncharacterized protein (DUF4213/DUF364 family)
MGLVEAWISDLQWRLGSEELVVSSVRVGVFYTAVQISSGHVGAAFTPRDLSDTVCCPATAASGPPAGRIVGRQIWEIASFALSESGLRRAVGIAALNAISALALSRYGVPEGEVCPGLDALEAAEVRDDDRIVMVGAFVPFIKALKQRGVAGLRVVDKHPDALKPDERSCWVAPEDAQESLLQASVVIISGSALVEGGIDDLLAASSRARRVVLAGPTASPWPPPFFRYGIDVLGGIRVRDSERMLTLVSEGGSGYLFKEVADKISIVKHRVPAFDGGRSASAYV